MKSILCPVDATAGAYQTVRYAALLAKDRNARILLAPLQSEGVPVLAGSGTEEGTEDNGQHLAELRDLVNSVYKVRCTLSEKPIAPNRLAEITSATSDLELVVAGIPKPGTKRAIAHTEQLVELIRNTKLPLLAVPEKTEYKKVNRILYAFDHHHESDVPLSKLSMLAESFGAEVRFLSILPEDISSTEEEKINVIHNRIQNRWTGKLKVSFETITYSDVAKCLDHYLNVWRLNDLLVLSVNQEVKWSKIWHKSVVKELLKVASQPYMVLPR